MSTTEVIIWCVLMTVTVSQTNLPQIQMWNISIQKSLLITNVNTSTVLGWRPARPTIQFMGPQHH